MKSVAACLLFAFAASASPGRPQRPVEDPIRRTQELERRLEASRKVGGPRAQGRASYELGKVTKTYGDYGAATKHLEEAALHASKMHDRGALARVLLNLGRVHWRQGRLDLSLEAYRRALSIYEELNIRAGAILARQEMGAASAMLGKAKDGLDLSLEALEMTRDAASRQTQADRSCAELQQGWGISARRSDQ